ncbi:MAG TPA: glycosyltransferase 87 family protein [Opitutaceae bacterium]|nr:glycosyltransferase 87 family protein [Opitutaceae bacterium]
MSEPTENGSGDTIPERFFASGRRWLLGCLLLGGLLLAGLAAARGYQHAWDAWGIQASHTPFLDLQVVTAGAESRALGFDPLHENPRDPLRRQLNYPRVWQSLAHLGVERRHTTVLGIGVVAAFLTAVLVFPRRLERGAALGLGMLLLSPAVMLAIERGNIDLVLFVVAALALLAARRSTVAATGLLLVGFGLKLYPVCGAALLLREGRNRFVAFAVGLAAVVGAYVFWQHEELRAIRAATPSDTFLSYGLVPAARVLAATLAGVSPGLRSFGLFAAGGAGLAFVAVLSWRGCRPAAGSDTPTAELDAFRLGAGIFAGTFLLGSNFDYRLVFLLFTVPQLRLWARGEKRELRIAARMTVAAVLLATWQMIWRPLLARFVGESAAALFEQVAKTAAFGGCAYLFVATAPVWLLAGCARVWASSAEVWRGEAGRPRFLLPVVGALSGLAVLAVLHWHGGVPGSERLTLPTTRINALLAQALWCDDGAQVAAIQAQGRVPQPYARAVGWTAALVDVSAGRVLRAAQVLATALALVAVWSLGREWRKPAWLRLALFATAVWVCAGLQAGAYTQWALPALAAGLWGGWLVWRARAARGRGRWLAGTGAAAAGLFAVVEFIGGIVGGPARGPRIDVGGLIAALKELTPPGSTWLIAGDARSQLLPVVAGRRSRVAEIGCDAAPLAVAPLETEFVGALVLSRAAAEGAEPTELCARLNLDDAPTFEHPLGRVYLSRFARDAAVTRLAAKPFADVTSVASYESAEPLTTPRRVPPGAAVRMFPMITPAPVAYDLAFGYALWSIDGLQVLRAHADSSLWVEIPARAARIEWEFGLTDGSYRSDPATNGAEFVVEAEAADGGRRIVFSRLLDPADAPCDRGLQRESISFATRPGERRLVFRTASNGDKTCDSAYWRRIRVQ